MPDTFTNARPYFDPTFPSSGDGFSISGFKRQFQALAFLDAIPMQPRAHNPANTSIMVRGRDASSFYNPIYYGSADQRIFLGSGDTPAFATPVSNPRVDIVFLNVSGDVLIHRGTEAVSPTLPSMGASGDTRIPICAVWNRPGQARIVNFEDKDSNTGDGYIYQDLRPWFNFPKAASTGLTVSSAAALSVTGDNAAGSSAQASRADHTHQGIHTIRKVGSSNMFGDVEFAGTDITQGASRLTWIGETIKGWVNFNGSGTVAINDSFNVTSITDNATGDYTVNWTTAFANANYAVSGSATGTGGQNSLIFTMSSVGLAVGSARVFITANSAGANDSDSVQVIAIGDR